MKRCWLVAIGGCSTTELLKKGDIAAKNVVPMTDGYKTSL
jgi:hypothetical protein